MATQAGPSDDDDDVYQAHSTNLDYRSASHQTSRPTNRVYIALFDFERKSSEDLSFKKGEKLRVLQVHNQEGDWWMARSLDSGRGGYIPSNYVIDALVDKDWYFGTISRAEAEMLLQEPGSFLVRDSETKFGEYELCVQDRESVKHYHIKHQLKPGGFFITQFLFSTMKKLIEHYKKNAGDLCCTLNSTYTAVQRPMLEIPRNSVTLERLLGKGKFGELYKGLWNEGVPVAVRVVKEDIMLSFALLEEADTLKNLHHPNLVKLYGVCIKDGPILIITELMPNGSLSLLVYLHSREVDNPQLIDIAAQVADGMAYLERNKHIHCSLAARSVLISGDNKCKVADYGLARLIKDDKRNFLIKWLAPEVLLYNRFSIKSDVWSFGILLYELVTRGSMPYPGMTNADVLQELVQGYRMPAPPNTPERLYVMMLDCWKEEPADRLTFETLQWQTEEYRQLMFRTLQQKMEEFEYLPYRLALETHQWPMEEFDANQEMEEFDVYQEI